MAFEPGDQAYVTDDGYEVEIVSGPHCAYQVQYPNGDVVIKVDNTLSATPPDPRREAIRKGLYAVTGTHTLRTGSGSGYPVDQEDLIACILAALDEVGPNYAYRDSDGDLWERMPDGLYKHTEGPTGYGIVSGQTVDSLDKLQRRYGPLTPVAR